MTTTNDTSAAALAGLFAQVRKEHQEGTRALAEAEKAMAQALDAGDPSAYARAKKAHRQAAVLAGITNDRTR